MFKIKQIWKNKKLEEETKVCRKPAREHMKGRKNYTTNKGRGGGKEEDVEGRE